jgi:hypothetical protein
VISPITETDNGKIQIVSLSPDQGFGLEDDAHLEAKKKFAIRVSDQIDYCISFWFKQTLVTPSLELSMRGFSCDYEKEYLQTSIETKQAEKYFISPNEKIICMENQYYFARYVLYAAGTEMPVDRTKSLTSLGVGRNLVMQEGTTNIFINLVCRGDNPTARKVKIWNFKVRPLRTPFSTGFVQSANLLEIWRKNNKKQFTEKQIDNVAENYLLPYNSIQAVINL